MIFMKVCMNLCQSNFSSKLSLSLFRRQKDNGGKNITKKTLRLERSHGTPHLATRPFESMAIFRFQKPG